MAKTNVVRMERITEVDHKTGEITKENIVQSVVFGSEPPYIKMYLDDLSDILNIPNAQRTVLDLMLPKLDYDGYITLSTRYRKEMASKLNITDQSLRNSIAKLVKAGIIQNTGRGEYMVNPFLFARGEWKNIVEQRQEFTLKITYSESGRTITTEKEAAN